MECVSLSEKLAEIRDGNLTLLLSKSPSMAYSKCGFSPVILYETRTFDESLAGLVKYGAVADGEPVLGQNGRSVFL